MLHLCLDPSLVSMLGVQCKREWICVWGHHNWSLDETPWAHQAPLLLPGWNTGAKLTYAGPSVFSTVPFLAALLLLLLLGYYNGNWIHALTQVLVIHLLMVHSRLRTIFPSISAEQAAAERSFLKVSQDQAVAFSWMKKVKTHNCTHAHADQWLFTCTVLQQKGQRIIYIERKQKTNIVWLSLFSVTCSLGLYGSLMTFPLFVSVRLVSTTTSSSTLSSLIVKTHRLLNLPQNKCTKQACQALQFYVCGATPDNLTPFIENLFETRNTETANV